MRRQSSRFFKPPSVFALILWVALAGCSSLGQPPAETYDLVVASIPNKKAAGRISKQLLVPAPGASELLSSNKILVREQGDRLTYLPGVQWSGELPKLVQERIAESLEDSGRARAIGRPGEGLAIDYQLIVSIRHFELDIADQKKVRINFFTKVLDETTGRIIAQRNFDYAQAATSDDARAVTRALNVAFAEVSADLVAWTLKVTP